MKVPPQFEDDLLKTNEDIVPQICEIFHVFALCGGRASLCPPPYKCNFVTVILSSFALSVEYHFQT